MREPVRPPSHSNPLVNLTRVSATSRTQSARQDPYVALGPEFTPEPSFQQPPAVGTPQACPPGSPRPKCDRCKDRPRAPGKRLYCAPCAEEAWNVARRERRDRERAAG